MKQKGEVKMKKIVMTVSLVVFVLVAFQVMAHSPGGQGNNAGNSGWTQALTQEQQTRINSLRQKFMQDTLETRKKLMAKRLELRTLMAQPNMDVEKAKALHNEILTLQSEIQKQRFEFQLAVRKIAPTAASCRGMWGPGNGSGMYRKGMGQNSPMGMGMGMGHGGYGRGHRGAGGCPGCF